MTLDEFVKIAPSEIEAFAAYARGDIEEEGEASTRSEAEWWEWMAAYKEYMEFSDSLRSDRRQSVERRQITKRKRAG